MAGALNNLGAVLAKLGKPKDALKRAWKTVKLYRQLVAGNRSKFLPDLAWSLSNVGSRLSEMGQWEAAVACAREAVDLCRELARRNRAAFLPNLAGALSNLVPGLAEMGQGEEALRCALEAAALYDNAAEAHPSVFLLEQRDSWANLGRFCYLNAQATGLRGCSEARVAFRRARAAAESLRGGFREPAQRQRILAESLGVYEGLALACVGVAVSEQDPKALAEAVEAGEASRARYLLDLLADELIVPANTPPGLVAEFGDVRRRLQQARRRLQLEVDEQREARSSPQFPRDRPGLGSASDSSAKATRLAAPGGVSLGASPARSGSPQERLAACEREVADLEARQAATLKEVHRCDPLFNPDQPVAPVGYPQSRELLSDDATVLVQMNFMAAGGLVFLLTRSGVELVFLETFGKAPALALAREWMRAYYGLRAQTPDWHPTWGEAIPPLLEAWSRVLVAPALAALPPGTRRLVLCPSQATHLIPFHACRMADGRLVAEAFEVVYTPSLSLLHRCARIQRPACARELLVVDPTSNLRFAPAEGSAYHHRNPGARVLERGHAKREAIFEASPESGVFHYRATRSSTPPTRWDRV